MVRRGLQAARGKTAQPAGQIHFLHVGKAAGTQVERVIQQVNQHRQTNRLVRHGHGVALGDLPKTDAYFFSTRDPATRFKSGFYSRLRKGQPRIHIEWTDNEKLAFSHFEHANDLAEALFNPGQLGRNATAAMLSIRHPSRNLVDWFKFHGNLFEVRPPVWIIRQEQFSDDLNVFLKRIGHTGHVELATNKTSSHANDYDGVPPLSDLANANLRRWYAQDYAFLDLCDAWMEKAADPA